MSGVSHCIRANTTDVDAHRTNDDCPSLCLAAKSLITIHYSLRREHVFSAQIAHNSCSHRSSSFVIVPMSTNPEHRPGVKAKSETERQTRKREKDARAQQRARERNKSKGLRAAVHDANLNGPPTPHIVRQAQSALTTQEQMIPQKEQELAQATAERKRAAADLTLARLQVRIDETTDQVDELKQETELVLGGDDEGLSSTLLGASLDAVVPPYDGGRPQNSDTLDVVMLPASGQKARHAHFSLGS